MASSPGNEPGLSVAAAPPSLPNKPIRLGHSVLRFASRYKVTLGYTPKK